MENKAETIQKVVAWLKDYAVKNDKRSFVVGVSGGIDSALVSTLCAMTGLQTHCVILPCQSRDDGIIRGCQHINWLADKFGRYGNAVHSHRIELDKVFRKFVKATEPYFGIDRLAYANVKSRLRMVALYHVAIIHNGLVVGTGNKVEDFGIGFFTKYGDGGVDISPIADFTKTEVGELSKELGIIEEIIKATPTDGLWDDQRSDEQAIGATYKELEWAMKTSESAPCEYEAPSFTAREKKVLEIYKSRHAAAQHKLNPIPTFKR